MNENAIRELEVKVAFLEDSLQKLSDEFFTQQREMEQLKTKYATLVNKFRDLQGAGDDGVESHDERPPHY